MGGGEGGDLGEGGRAGRSRGWGPVCQQHNALKGQQGFCMCALSLLKLWRCFAWGWSCSPGLRVCDRAAFPE